MFGFLKSRPKEPAKLPEYMRMRIPATTQPKATPPAASQVDKFNQRYSDPFKSGEHVSLRYKKPKLERINKTKRQKKMCKSLEEIDVFTGD